MIKELCRILKLKLEDLPFIDVLAGLALTVTKAEAVGDTDVTTTTIRFPVSDDTNQDAEIFGPEINLVPEEARRSIIYFEDFGTARSGTRGANQVYTASIRLICWMNRERLGMGMEPAVTARIEAQIIQRLTARQYESYGIFNRLFYNIIRIPPKDAALFGRYTYDEKQRQFLRPPFDWFAIDIAVNFEINTKCVF